MTRFWQRRDEQANARRVTADMGVVGRLTVILSMNDRARHHGVQHEILVRARRAGLAGMSVFLGVSGYGRSRIVHTNRILSMSDGLPVMIVIVDAEQAVRAFLPVLKEIAPDALILLDRVEVHGPGGGQSDGVIR